MKGIALNDSTRPSRFRIGWVAAASLVVSNMVGAGIFTTSGFLLENLRSPLIMIAAWAVGGILALCGTLAYAELGASLPQVGGDYVYLRKAYGPLWGFMSGWMAFFAGIGTPICLTALTFTEYLTPLAPGLSIQGHEPFLEVSGLTLTLSAGHLVAIGLIWLLSLVHYLGIRRGGKLQVAVTSLNMLLIFSFILFAFLFATGDWGHFTSLPKSAPAVSTGLFPLFAVSMIWIMYSYSGFNAAAYVAGEIERPGRNLPLALLVGTGTVTLLYLALNAVYIYACPVQELSGKLDVAKIAAITLFGPGIGWLFSTIIATCALASSSAMVCIGPRIYQAMASDGLFFASAARTSRKFGTPGVALLLQALWSSLLIMVGSFDQLLTYCGFLLSFFAALTVSAVIVLRHRHPELARPYKAWGYPLTPAFFVAVSLWMMIYAVFTRPAESMIGAVVVGLGIPAYFIWKRKS